MHQMKILYYYSQLNIGGAEKSTVRLLNLMADKGWNVTLLLRWNAGILEKDLNPDVRVIHLKYERNNHIFGKFGDLVWFIFQTLLCKKREHTLSRDSYDIAINGLFGYNPKLLLKNVRAEKRYQMLRNDVEKTSKYGKTELYVNKYGKYFDKYIGVSKYTTQTFINCYPQYANRACTIYNVISNTEATKMYENPYPALDNNIIKILTVGRLCDKAKGLFRMLDVAELMKRDGFSHFKWFIVGEGEDGKEFEERCFSRGLNDMFVFCGKKTDPFPYYRHADIIAVLSYYEGLCGVVNESKMMEKCLIATKFSGIEEQIVDGKNGLIVENQTEAIVQGLEKLLLNEELRDRLSCNGLPAEIMDNDMKINQFRDLFFNKLQ